MVGVLASQARDNIQACAMLVGIVAGVVIQSWTRAACCVTCLNCQATKQRSWTDFAIGSAKWLLVP
jgi:hypothetical protein